MIFSRWSKICGYFDNPGAWTNGCAISEVLRRFFKSDRTPVPLPWVEWRVDNLGGWIESGCGWGVNGTLDGCLAGMVESMVGGRWLLVAVSGMMKKFGEGVLGK